MVLGLHGGTGARSPDVKWEGMGWIWTCGRLRCGNRRFVGSRVGSRRSGTNPEVSIRLAEAGETGWMEDERKISHSWFLMSFRVCWRTLDARTTAV